MSNSLCSHSSCIQSSFLGLRQGLYYGAKIRFFHALVMTMLFRPGTLKQKIITILKLTYQHSKNLGIFVFLYKSAVCLLTNLTQRSTTLHNFIAGALIGWAVFGRDKSAVNQQIVLYLLSRVSLGIASNLQRRKLINQRLDAFPLLAAFVWGLVMWLFENDKGCLQSSLTSSMNFLYKESDRDAASWMDFLPLEWPDFLR